MGITNTTPNGYENAILESKSELVSALPIAFNALESVYKRLRRANRKVQLAKTEFLKREVAYLGQVINPNGVEPNPEKIVAVQNYPISTTPKEIKCFLGLLGYYRKFI